MFVEPNMFVVGFAVSSLNRSPLQAKKYRDAPPKAEPPKKPPPVVPVCPVCPAGGWPRNPPPVEFPVVELLLPCPAGCPKKLIMS